MAKLIDMLLGAGDKITGRPTAALRISRLSEICGDDFVFEIRGLTQKEISNLGESTSKADLIIAGVTNFDFGDKELSEALKPEGRSTPLFPPEVVDAILLPGEKNAICNKIFELSGFGDNAVKEIEKNSKPTRK